MNNFKAYKKTPVKKLLFFYWVLIIVVFSLLSIAVLLFNKRQQHIKALEVSKSFVQKSENESVSLGESRPILSK